MKKNFLRAKKTRKISNNIGLFFGGLFIIITIIIEKEPKFCSPKDERMGGGMELLKPGASMVLKKGMDW